MKDLARKVGDLLQRHHAYRTVFATPEGQIVLRDLVRFSQFSADPAAGGDPHHTYFNLGMQRIVRRIASFCHMSDLETLRLAQQLEEKRRDEDDQSD